jgi:thymidylate synthase
MKNKYFSGRDFDNIYRNIGRTLLDYPAYSVKNKSNENLNEEINLTFEIFSPRLCFALCRNMSLTYLKGELDWYLSGNPKIEQILQYSKFWKGISDDGWSANSNYGKLLLHDRNLHNYTQFQYALECLLNNPESKKSVMVIYKHDASFKSKDNPWTMYLQFFIRNWFLYLYVKMRSSDIYFGLPYDVPFFVLLQYRMLSILKEKKYPNLQIGFYNHNSGSLHLYERNFEQLRTAFENYSQENSDWNKTKIKKEELFKEIIESRL